METALEFMKLEKIELGGIQGKSLSAQVISVFEEFQEHYKVFSEGTFDCLDPEQKVTDLSICVGLVSVIGSCSICW